MICIAKLLLCSSLAPRALLPYGTDSSCQRLKFWKQLMLMGNKKIILFSKHVIIGVIMNTFYVLKLH